jgi:3'-5' exoribonuclease
LRAKQEHDWQTIADLLATLADPRLRALSERFLAEQGARFRRSAAARRNHHARRGGLVEHVAQMMRAAAALCGVYPDLNRDLLLAGVLFHDCGKLWENGYPEDGFQQLVTLRGEMLGHIPLGIEVVNKLWRDMLDSPAARGWLELTPSNEDVRLHLLHLVGSHHGQLEFGSPVLPRTPEAFALHYIDNLDAKLEMVKDAYAQAAEIAPGVRDRVFPLPATLVDPLPAFAVPPPPAAPATPPARHGELFSF